MRTSSSSRIRSSTTGVIGAALLCIVSSGAHATNIPLGVATNYALLYTGGGGNQLSISNVTVSGNIGVAGTGKVAFTGPGTIAGELDFSAANTGQYSNSNSSNIGPISVKYNVANVTTALNTVDSLNSTLGALSGTNLAINVNGQNQTVNESAGTLHTVNGVTYAVFNVTSYTANNGFNLIINSNGSGDPVVFNFGFNSNVNLGGDTILNGLTPDQVLYNFTSTGKNINLQNNASSFGVGPSAPAFQGIILAPNDALSTDNSNIVGRMFGGDSHNFQFVSGANIFMPPTVPEPPSFGALVAGLMILGLLRWIPPLRRRAYSA